MKTSSLFVHTIAAALLCCVARAQSNVLEDHPFEPSASVVKGTVAALSDSSEEVVALAVRALADWRQASVAADVAKLLAPTVPGAVRMEALQFFARLGPQAKPQVAEVLKYASDPDPNIRAAVLAVILAAQASAENAGAIRPLLDDSRGDVRVAVAKCLGQAGKAAAAHRKALLDALATSGSEEFKAAALQALHEIGGLTSADLDAITPFLRDRDAEVRIAAWAATLSEVVAAKASGALTDEKVQAFRDLLIAQFHSEPPEIKASMIEDAGANKATAEASVAELVKQIRTGTTETKAAALRVLGKAREAAIEQLALIVESGKDGDSTIRAAAIAALGSIGAVAVKPNLELVANALRDPSDLVRSEALLALPAAGDALKNFPYRILDIFAGETDAVRTSLVKAVPIILRARGIDDEVIADGRAALKDPNPDVRIAVAFVIAQFGKTTGAALLPGLIELTKDPEPSVRGAAAISLRAYASDDASKQTLRAGLRPLLKDRDAQVRWAALDTLHELAPAQEPGLVAEIAALLKDEDEPVRNAAVRALGAAGAAAKPHLSDIISFFDDDPAVPPYAAAQAVLEIGPLTPQELTSLLYPLYVYAELQPLTRLTAYGASGGERDGLLIVRLLGRSRSVVKDVVPKADEARVTALLRDALKAPLLHEKLKAEITSRLTELTTNP